MINIAYNRQLPLCASPTTPSVRNGKRVCRPPTDLCTPDPDFQFNLHEGDGNEVSSFVLVIRVASDAYIPRIIVGLC